MANTSNRMHMLKPAWGKGSHLLRFEAVKPYVEGKRVLDIGCVVGYRRGDWFHGLLHSVAGELTGVDIDGEVVSILRDRGYDIAWGDAQSLDLGRSFDVVFAGELIEHLDNFRGFLSGVRKHLDGEGLLILTTPNVFGFSNFVYRLSRNAWLNREHTCWFDEGTIQQLLERNGFTIQKLQYLRHRTPGTIRRLVMGTIRAVLPDRLSWNTMLVVARPSS